MSYTITQMQRTKYRKKDLYIEKKEKQKEFNHFI